VSRTAGEPADPLEVLVVDDHRVFAEVLRLGVDSQPGLRCRTVAHSAHEALSRASTAEFDVAVVDLELPDASGFEIIESLRQRHPRLRILVLTAYARPPHARRALDAGAAGFLGKESSLARVLDAIRATTLPGQPAALPPTLDEQSPVRLTPREHDVLRELGLGRDANQIADALGISLFTTRDHIKALMRKLGAQSQLGAVVAAEQLGLVTVGHRF
jgi:DNA-binding NarL/FixJ family response regulator